MNIIEWLNLNFNAGDAIDYGLIAFVIWSVLWNLISFITSKIKDYSLNYDLMNEGPILGTIGSFGIALFLSVIVVLIVASIQAVIEYGAKLVFPYLIFSGIITAFVIFFIKKINK